MQQNPGGTTNVTVLLTSTANDQLADFHIEITGLTLTNKAGQSVTVLNNPDAANDVLGGFEFMHLNGAFAPLVSAVIPQDAYSSATVKVARCDFTNISLTPSGGLLTADFEQGLCSQGTGLTTVSLPLPIVISGTSAVLSLDLQVTQSYTLTTTQGINGPTQSYTISPSFILTPLSISAQPVSGFVTALDLRFASLSAVGNSFVATTPNGSSLSLATNAATIYQGVSGLSSITVGALVDLDAAVQADGSLLARRVQVNDPAALAEFVGPWTFTNGQPGQFVILPNDCFPAPDVVVCESAVQTTSGAAFSVSGEFSNLQNLPFVPEFGASSLVLGQNFSSLSQGANTPQGTPLVTAVALRPQTINGTVTNISSSNGLSIYTVSLAAYDLFPIVQSAAGPVSQNIANPSTITVYADANTQLLTTNSIGVGSVVRFRGAIFNDNGVLRMDCQKILDGVAE
ncbi:MAG: DUF5666 domain-containing protein [Candidatus Acidiferrales bacterium]